MSEEIWKEIPGYPGYEISSHGQIKSHRNGPAKIRKLNTNDSGYKCLILYVNKEQKNEYVHRLVAITFIPNPHNYMFVDHIDGIKKNNHMTNLRWVSAEVNFNNAKIKRGKAVIQYDLEGNMIGTHESATAAARELNLIAKSIQACARGKISHEGEFRWKYVTPLEKYEPKPGEIFKSLVGEFGKYKFNFPKHSVSNYGTILRNSKMPLTIHMANGYPRVNIHYSGKSNPYAVHILVAIFFIDGRTDDNDVINHKDENKLNYHFTNLEWCTRSYNAKYSIYKICKKVEQINVDTGDVIETYASITEAVKELGLPDGTRTHISECCKGKRNHAGGFAWKYVTISA